MGNGAKFPNGAKYPQTTFTSSGTTSWSYYRSGSVYATYVKAVTGYGYIFDYNSGDSSISYPSHKTLGIGSYVYSRSGNDVVSAGQITAANYYTATVTKNIDSAGTVSGGGTVWSGDTTSASASANDGYYISTINGTTINDFTGSVTGIAVSSDITIPVVFASAAQVRYYRNYTSSDTTILETQNLIPGSSATVISQTRTNYTLLGWATSRNGSVVYVPGDVITVNTSINLYAVWAAYFTVEFNANGGTGSIASQEFVSGVAQNLTKNTAITRTGYAFSGWADEDGNTYVDGADGSGILSAVGGSAGDTVILYAQWTYTAFNVTIEKSYVGGAAGATLPNIGTLSLVRVSDNTTVATEDETTHQIYYEGTANESGSSSEQYQVVLTMASTKPDMLWSATGITDGGRISGGVITPIKGDTLSYSYVITKRELYSFAFAYSPSGAGSAIVTNPSEADDSTKYISGRDLEITATPSTGYELTTAQGTSGAKYENIQDNKFTYVNLSSDETLTLYFEKITYTATVAKDSASDSAISAVAITGSSTGVKDYQVGDTVTLVATVASGFSFDGWYVDGERVSTSATYAYSGTGTKTFVAKAKVSVTLGVVYTGKTSEQQESCILRVNNASYTLGTAFDVILGQSFSYELAMGSIVSGGSELWKFNAWFNSTDVSSRTNPLAYGLSGTITPTSAMDIVAEVTASLITNVITIVMKEDENQTDISRNGVITTSIEPDAGGWDSTQNKYILTFYGTKSVKITSLATVPSTLYAFNKYVDGTAECATPEYEILTSGNRTITAWYGSTGTRTTTLAYGASGSGTGDRTMGTFEISSTTDPDGTISSDKTSAVVNRGYSITIVAKPKNGYRFRGWYTTREVGGDAFLDGTEETMVITTNRNLFAWFTQDSTAVYEWEGTGNPKSFVWQSKVYKAAKPFNPTCCRVDTEGYPVIELDVDMFSAPDTAATAQTVLTNVASQTARRLPVRRMERYIQICIKNDHEVDALYVGTNMAEMAQ